MGQWEVKKRSFKGCKSSSRNGSSSNGSRSSSRCKASGKEGLVSALGQLGLGSEDSISIPAELLDSLEPDAAVAEIEEQNNGYDDRLLISEDIL